MKYLVITADYDSYEEEYNYNTHVVESEEKLLEEFMNDKNNRIDKIYVIDRELEIKFVHRLKDGDKVLAEK